MKKLIVTRHPALVEYLRQLDLVDSSAEVVTHATPDKVAGRHVYGVLPHHLSCLCTAYTEVPLLLPVELRGHELTLAQVEQYAQPVQTYTVQIII
ncbi:MAG TPA: hypothetical protein ENI67_04755 [Gammaproteobacteria bacterium]|nr:hypothetical protein [Gammaproteobacteria bacterium]